MGVGISIAIVAIAYALGFGTGFKVDTWKNTAEQASELKAAQDKAAQEREFRGVVSDKFEAKLSKLHITNTTINQEVRHEVEKTVYGDPNCNLPVSGVSLRDAKVDAANEGLSKQPVANVSIDSKTGKGQASFFGRFISGGSGSN